MKWKKRFSGIFLFLTLLHCALCNRQSHEKTGLKNGDNSQETGAAVVPGPETAILQSGHIVHLDNMSFLDPYNLMASMKRGKEDDFSKNPLLKIVSSNGGQKKDDSNSKRKPERKQSNNGSNSEEKKNRQSLSKSTGASIEQTGNSSKDAQKSHFSKETSPFGENDFDVYDDYSDYEGSDNDFDNLDTIRRGGKIRKWKKRYEQRNALLHEAVRKLLGFSQSHKASSKHRRLLPDPYQQDKLPRYVKDLYERFQSGEMSAGLAKGNTVRSIHGSIGEIDGRSVFLFNLSSLRSSEQLLNAEIHLYKRKLRQKLHTLDIEVRLYQVASHKVREAGKIIMRDSGFGWQWYDVTMAAKNCLTPRHHSLLALSFRANKSNGKSKTVSLRKFGRRHSMPFLVLYSNETEAASFDQLDLLADRLWASGDHNLNQALSPNPDKDVNKEENGTEASRNEKSHKGKEEHHRSSKSPHKETNKTSELTSDTIRASTSAQSPATKLSTISRIKRSIYTNEIPEGPNMNFKKFQYHSKIPHTHPGVLKPRKESKMGYDKRGYMSMRPGHNVGGVHRRRRKKHRTKKHRKGRLGFPKEWDNYVLRKKKVDKKETGDVCGRKKLTVDFADIGWGDWIISPKSFDAHYCSGSCPFPIMKHLRPSNHATIQSIVHAIGIQGKVPAPCCVPDVMSSVTLLYFDEDRNVVLKNYPGMTVDSCACR